jgi:hypothetical protein
MSKLRRLRIPFAPSQMNASIASSPIACPTMIEPSALAASALE